MTIQKPPANRATPVSRPILRRRSQFIIVLHRAYGESSHTSLGESSRQNNNIADLILAPLCRLAQIVDPHGAAIQSPAFGALGRRIRVVTKGLRRDRTSTRVVLFPT